MNELRNALLEVGVGGRGWVEWLNVDRRDANREAHMGIELQF